MTDLRRVTAGVIALLIDADVFGAAHLHLGLEAYRMERGSPYAMRWAKDGAPLQLVLGLYTTAAPTKSESACKSSSMTRGSSMSGSDPRAGGDPLGVPIYGVQGLALGDVATITGLDAALAADYAAQSAAAYPASGWGAVTDILDSRARQAFEEAGIALIESGDSILGQILGGESFPSTVPATTVGDGPATGTTGERTMFELVDTFYGVDPQQIMSGLLRGLTIADGQPARVYRHSAADQMCKEIRSWQMLLEVRINAAGASLRGVATQSLN